METVTTEKNRSVSKPFIISRDFDAPRDLVWKAWTERKRLMQWFGPKGYTMPAAKLYFYPGGSLNYCLRSPDVKKCGASWFTAKSMPRSESSS